MLRNYVSSDIVMRGGGRKHCGGGHGRNLHGAREVHDVRLVAKISSSDIHLTYRFALKLHALLIDKLIRWTRSTNCLTCIIHPRLATIMH